MNYLQSRNMSFSARVSAWMAGVTLVCTFFVGSAAAYTMTESWVALYDGSKQLADRTNAVAVDGSGNVYVTGYGASDSYDVTTIKYDSNGNQEWIARYDGGNGGDYGSAIAVDSSGNVYVTGGSIGPTMLYDYVTIKYDSDGNQIWAVRYNGPDNGDDAPSAIEIDGSGCVYVAGQSIGSASAYDYATVKYDFNGTQVWVARYNGPGNGSDHAYSLAVDNSGSVYVTGMSYGSGSDRDYATIKYDANGTHVWTARYNGPWNGADSASSLAVDDSGNVFVTGSSSNGTDGDYATIKYDSGGHALWVARYNGPGNDSDYAASIGLNSGNVYVTGGSTGESGAYDYATIKYDFNGNETWVARYNGPGNGSDTAHALAVDSSGRVYVTGSSDGVRDTLSDYATIKYDSSGNQVWEARFNGPMNGLDDAFSLALDASGNVYVTGSTSSPDYMSIASATIKYGQNCGNIIQTITPPAISTAVPGGTLNFSSAETNNCTYTALFSVQPYIVNPDGATVWFKKVRTSLPAGETRTRPLSYTIPMDSEQGNFTWGVVMRDTNGDPIDEDTFPFTVVTPSNSVERRSDETGIEQTNELK